jgi:hypothetical protein
MPSSNEQPKVNGVLYRRNGASNEPLDQVRESTAIDAGPVISVNVASQSASFIRGEPQTTPPHARRLAGAVAMKQDAYREFRRICDELYEEVAQIDDYVVGGGVVDEGLATVAEIEHHLERLYDCEWGEDECLKRLVVAVQAQLGNTKWTGTHVELLKTIVPFLRVRWLINDATVSECYEIIEEMGLDQFRGTLSGDDVVRRYVLQEVKDE